ncbi:hypothetical protein AVEN_42602-1 [Araneus ventricosus]|uniref:Uncharacterized protein n=1 Tax=Araneus ventricosus TaxID=182803 RepID=A0A4Y2JTE4_ARAVE|nr:hypothetical protein AVEN_42602-1 [Araneus ventricosus]
MNYYKIANRAEIVVDILDEDGSVTNMESRFPAMRVLWLGREFYRGKYEMTGSSHVWTPDLGDHLSDKIGDEIWDLKGAGIFSISLLGEKIRHECTRSFHVTSQPTGETI